MTKSRGPSDEVKLRGRVRGKPEVWVVAKGLSC